MLYALLKEREEKVNISHRRMPSLAEHRKFVKSKPYKAWFLIRAAGSTAGAIYLSKMNEIGVFVFKKHRGKGYGKGAVAALMQKFKGAERFLANVNPANADSIAFFKSFGFRHIQNTYEKRKK